ncbi:MAG TPA: DinB family protein [Ktedonobacterales bacterium]|jgi:uncharacterized damage-inducible protein DinB|nr:DinB family protein [Ktedonobacterales bacterium]
MTTARDVYQGWETYHRRFIRAISPLTQEQLGFRTAESLRSIGDICRHVIGARARWCEQILGLNGDTLSSLGQWDAREAPERSAIELVDGLQGSWAALWDALGAWTIADLTHSIPNPDREPGEPEVFTRQWVIWHLIEHDLHHGGEVSLILGSHQLSGIDI